MCPSLCSLFAAPRSAGTGNERTYLHQDSVVDPTRWVSKYEFDSSVSIVAAASSPPASEVSAVLSYVLPVTVVTVLLHTLALVTQPKCHVHCHPQYPHGGGLGSIDTTIGIVSLLRIRTRY